MGGSMASSSTWTPVAAARRLVARYPSVRRAARWAFRRSPVLNRFADSLVRRSAAEPWPARRPAAKPASGSGDIIGWFSPYFNEPLVDLGMHESADFAGVLSPKSEVGAARAGVNAVFLDNAEDYYKKYQGFDYWRKLLVEALQRCGASEPALVVEYGCGFGNATLPMLDLIPNCRVIASDISPNLLSIMERLLAARGLKERCVSVAMDAQKPYLIEGCADLVFGAAILHHLVEPAEFVKSIMRVVKPGGTAFFFEPMEGGHAILIAICEQICREAKRRGHWDHGIYLTERFANELRPQIFRDAVPGWRDRDDKWMFSRSMLDDIARAAGATVATYGLHDTIGQFSRHFSYMLQTYGGMNPADYPDWAWEIFDRCDKAMFSPDMLRDLPFEGCIMFRRSA
jgi:SAM-dependent methyltransferase